MSRPRLNKRKLDDSEATAAASTSAAAADRSQTPPPSATDRAPPFTLEEGERILARLINQPPPVSADKRAAVEHLFARMITLLSAKSRYDESRLRDTNPVWDELVKYEDVVDQCFTVDSASAAYASSFFVAPRSFSSESYPLPRDLAVQRIADSAYVYLQRNVSSELFCSVSSQYGIPNEAPTFSQMEELERTASPTLRPLSPLDLGPTSDPKTPPPSATAAAAPPPPLPSALLAPPQVSAASSAASSPAALASTPVVGSASMIIRPHRIADVVTPSQADQIERARLHPDRLYGVSIVATAIVSGSELKSEIKFNSTLNITPMPVATDPIQSDQFWNIARLRLAMARDRMVSQYDRDLTDEIIRRLSQIPLPPVDDGAPSQ